MPSIMQSLSAAMHMRCKQTPQSRCLSSLPQLTCSVRNSLREFVRQAPIDDFDRC